MPSRKISATLLTKAGKRKLCPEDMEELLMKLNAFDLRPYFVRFAPAPRPAVPDPH